ARRQAQDLVGAADVGGLEIAVGQEPVDLRAAVVNGARVGGQARERGVAQAQLRPRQVARDDFDPTAVRGVERRGEPLEAALGGVGAKRAADGARGLRQELAQDVAAEKTAGAGYEDGAAAPRGLDARGLELGAQVRERRRGPEQARGDRLPEARLEPAL